MTAEENKMVNTLESRLRLLIDRYNRLKAENEELYAMVDKSERQIDALQEETKTLRSQYANLKVAKMMEIGDDDIRNAKNRLSKLVRDVDKCIALLNV